uniref:non-specific serine/threonine protein kinase n=1 Tax=Solanum lycopersicum TaxID=4081 RepID=A0A3Q7G0B2_SOLLC
GSIMKNNILLLLILLFLIQFSVSLSSSNETDQRALLAFHNLITTPNHFLANNWTKSPSFCSWFGVTCTPKRQRVVALDLPNLQLQGTISPSLANLSFLSVLNLQNNSFHGGIPYGLGHLPRLRVIDVKNNQLNGSIPTSLFQNRRVEVISLGEMWRGPWYVPQLRVLNLRKNSLTGIIPPSVGNATKMMNFSLSGNRVSGNIPTEVGNLSQLAFLSLRDNQLTGPIPPTLFNISSLLSVALKGKSIDVENIPEIRTHQLVSYQEIQRATNNFDESNLIGEGSSGSVYKGTLFGGTAVAIKVLDLENDQVCKRFDTKCQVMRNVRHRNLVPVITLCSSNYIRAFVLHFMPNGSLENWLYNEDRHLNLHQRVAVMLDAAMAVEYLHHGHVTPIVHCDLKPANILLDEDMVAHVGDFGISKILAVSKSVAHTETLGTLGYIAPEYGSEGIVSASGDVYSYGIILMEVLIKRRPTDEEICNENLDLRKWITQSISGRMMEVVNANLFSEKKQITCKSEMCITFMIELALDCTKETPESRITMKDIVKRLNKINNTFLET